MSAAPNTNAQRSTGDTMNVGEGVHFRPERLDAGDEVLEIFGPQVIASLRPLACGRGNGTRVCKASEASSVCQRATDGDEQGSD